MKFIALTNTAEFNISSKSCEPINEFLEDFFLIFMKYDNEDNNPIIELLQYNTSEIQTKVLEFTDKFKASLPSLNGVAAYFRKLKDGEAFFLLPNLNYDQFESIRLHDYLKAVANGLDFDTIHRQTKVLFEKIFQNYRLMAFGDKRILIGEPKRDNRICRFCKNSIPNVTFNNKSHAIPEGLGNKSIILNYECDLCNEKFSKTIEPDIVKYLALFRTFFNVKGKYGGKKLKGKNFDLKNEGSIMLSLYNIGDRPSELDSSYNIKLATNDSITLQNIYKAFCKFVLSVVDKDELQYFEKNIDWVNGIKQVKTLPKIAQIVSYHALSLHPKLFVYIRKSDDRKLPFAIGEFYFTCKLFVFIVPLSNQDDLDFTISNDYEHFWEMFQHYKRTSGWAFKDYSNDIAQEFSMNLNFELNDKKQN